MIRTGDLVFDSGLTSKDSRYSIYAYGLVTLVSESVIRVQFPDQDRIYLWDYVFSHLRVINGIS